MSLVIRRWKRSSRDSPRSQWRIGTEDGGDVIFPSDLRLRTLFKENVATRGEIVIKERGGNHLIAEIPSGLTPQDCTPFLKALWKETVFK
jgi:hypothetical protein